ncbi:MAG: YMGG-like glycine zipper-containing protein [Noviherbaspirillum sp.]
MRNSMYKVMRIFPLTGFLLLGACVSMPDGPTAMVLPGTGKSFDQFRLDDFECRQFAQGQLGNSSPGSAYLDSGVRTAALGTLLGAVAGAAINGSHGAGVGAGAGMALGGLSGTSAAHSSGYSVQQRYDTGYQQCMYAKGHKIPGASAYLGDRMGRSFRPSYPQSYREMPPPPPPPAGAPPAPPPR